MVNWVGTSHFTFDIVLSGLVCFVVGLVTYALVNRWPHFLVGLVAAILSSLFFANADSWLVAGNNHVEGWQLVFNGPSFKVGLVAFLLAHILMRKFSNRTALPGIGHAEITANDEDVRSVWVKFRL